MTFMEFFHAEWMWFAGLAVVFILIIMNEIKTVKHKAFIISAAKALQLSNNDEAIFVDIRDADTFKKSHIPSSVHVAAEQLATKLVDGTRFKDKVIILYCDSGATSIDKVEKLRKEHANLSLFSLQGGLNGWLQTNLPVESSKK
ncbi:rhodanese-like domain-containing protein [Wohlfahrtiimonas larvae]|uniref:Rhodanese domain-containing protein n=1 Tax=Wohlfahrtiimonas larvae TaxID=1157986 RepID=A0ABP9MXF4_9GAMM|nr:rhodanese-like domain-containing protein [Wohlfahrtiimonas larvae]